MNRISLGDTSDPFKSDLVRHIMKAFPDLLSFTIVPTLTEEVSATRTKKTSIKDLGLARKNGWPGTRNHEMAADLGRLQEIDDDLNSFHGIHNRIF